LCLDCRQLGSFYVCPTVNEEAVLHSVRAVFLDRDGVINRDDGYVGEQDRLVLLPHVAEGIRRIRALGYLVVVITNQSGIARGLFSEADVSSLHEWMREILAHDGAKIDGFYVCPHHPTAGQGPYRRQCTCRKPKPGLFHQAARELSICVEESIAVGDQLSDLEAALNAGVPERVLIGSRLNSHLSIVTRSVDNLVELAALLAKEGPLERRGDHH
jgi:D-glycero-D-manno-heptose 1,7-bisphosphate phosphatase